MFSSNSANNAIPFFRVNVLSRVGNPTDLAISSDWNLKAVIGHTHKKKVLSNSSPLFLITWSIPVGTNLTPL
jgi:hypothetical protein